MTRLFLLPEPSRTLAAVCLTLHLMQADPLGGKDGKEIRIQNAGMMKCIL